VQTDQGIKLISYKFNYTYNKYCKKKLKYQNLQLYIYTLAGDKGHVDFLKGGCCPL